MLPTRRAVIANALVALVAATALIPVMSSSASATVKCNTGSYIIGFANSKYVSAELGYTGSYYGMLRSRASEPGPWENYTICGYWDGFTHVDYIINEANGRYVSAELGYTGGDYGMLRARATSLGPWEKFDIVRYGPNGNMYYIRSKANGRYVSVELGYTGIKYAMLRARATSIGSWEKILISCGYPASCGFNS